MGLGLNTAISPTSSCLSCFLIMRYWHKEVSYQHLMCCMLSGVVIITAGCYSVPEWASVIMGLLAAPCYFLGIYFVRHGPIVAH